MPELILPYTDYDLTEEVNRLPNQFGLINALNIAPSEGKSSKYVRIEYRDGQIYVLAAKDRGAPADIGGAETEQGIILEIPHFPHLDKISVDDVDGVLEVLNGQITPKSIDAELFRQLKIIRQKHSITREYVRLGMLKGLIKDGKGRTLYDIYDVFGITKKTIDFKLGTAGTDVLAKCEELNDHVITNLKGETMNSVEVIVDTKFFGKLIQHPKVKEFWVQAQNAALHTTVARQHLGGNWGRVFEFGDILWREYKGALPVRNAAGAIIMEKNVADNTGHAYPTGTQSMFRTFDGPFYHMDRVNRAPSDGGVGEPILITTKELDHGEGYELKSQSNMLAVCKQPECQAEVVTSD